MILVPFFASSTLYGSVKRPLSLPFQTSVFLVWGDHKFIFLLLKHTPQLLLAERFVVNLTELYLRILLDRQTKHLSEPEHGPGLLSFLNYPKVEQNKLNNPTNTTIQPPNPSFLQKHVAHYLNLNLNFL